ncbi:MAG: hypothetical protein AAF915_19120 [Cyanobacteria bacterium P01_D01_bin.50]
MPFIQKIPKLYFDSSLVIFTAGDGKLFCLMDAKHINIAGMLKIQGNAA